MGCGGGGLRTHNQDAEDEEHAHGWVVGRLGGWLVGWVGGLVGGTGYVVGWVGLWVGGC